MFACGKLAIAANVCILGVLGTAKLKESEGYAHPRERLIGSSFWARIGEDIFLISAEDKEDVNSRLVTICPRNAVEIRLNLVFEAGRLIREIMCSPDSNDLKLYEQLPLVFTTAEANEVASALGMSRATFYRCLRRLSNQRLITFVEKGKYAKGKVN